MRSGALLLGVGEGKTFSAGTMTRKQAGFLALTVGLIFLAHATAYFTHEYSHAVTAWLLGWMRSPVGIDYGAFTLSNVLFQQDVGDGVDYPPIFAGGHGLQAALIAFAGPGIGNGVLYGVCFLVLRRPAAWTRPVSAMFVFWLAVMCAGNVWSYAPIRTVTTHADMAWMARGLGVSTWVLLPLVTAPSLVIMASLFTRLLPRAGGTFLAHGRVAEAFASMMVCFLYFVFFGDSGLAEHYGEVSAVLSIVSAFVLFPAVAMWRLSASFGPEG